MNTYKRWLMIVIGIGAALLGAALDVNAQSEGILYGKVHTVKTVYTGPIRWGSEEVLWTDLFNAVKVETRFDDIVSEQDRKNALSDYDWNISSIWNDNPAHQFRCQFGNIKALIPTSRGRVKLVLKDDSELLIEGEGYNDIGTRVHVLDDELGTVSLDWDKIEKIEFTGAPKKLGATFGLPLFGTVETARKEKITGYIVWDNDERTSIDKLDGDSEDGKVALKFQDIQSIQKSGRGCYVRLNSGRELQMTGSNDVNEENRGVFVITPDVGVIGVSWRAFRSLTFAKPEFPMPSFESFTAPRAVRGTVSRFDGDDLKGQVVYDVDEYLDFELIEGSENGIEYIIPMKNIKRITPKNADFSAVELRSGKTLLLGDARDVSSENGGIIVLRNGKSGAVYVRWRNLNEIVFE